MQIKKSLPIAALALMLPASGGLAQTASGRGLTEEAGGRRIKTFVFRAEASKVLAALARIAKVGIVTTDDLKEIVSVNLSDIGAEDAVKLVAAQAKASYRRIGNVFIVAPDKDMADILAKYGTQERVPLQNVIDPAKIQEVATQIHAAEPFVTARVAARNIILIGAPEDLERARGVLQELDAPYTGEPISSVSITLNTVPVADVQQILQTQFKLDAQKAGENAVVFSGKRSDVERAQAFIKELDKGREANTHYAVYQVKYASPTSLVSALRQAVRTLTVVSGPTSYNIPLQDLNLSTANSIGSSGGSGSSGSGSSGGGVGSSSGGSSGNSSGGSTSTGTGSQSVTGERSRSIILGGTIETVQSALKMAEELDTPTPQVVLDVKVVSTSPTTAQSLGIDWTDPGTAGTSASASITLPGSGTSFATLPFSRTATLNAFFQRQDVHVLAKPSITALDNQDGVVFVGETRRVSVSTIPTGVNTGNSVVLNNVVEIPVGIILQMRARVNEDDKITLHVHPVYSSAGAVNTATGLFNTFSREAETTVRIRSGETLVIGGLLQEEDTKTVTKIPLLGDIPFLGQLFRNHTTNHLRREVMVFVTPHLLHD